MSTTPAHIDMRLFQGDTFAYLFSFNENGNPFDLSSLADISFRMFTGCETIFEHSVTNGDLTIGGADGNELIGVASAETMDIPKRTYLLQMRFYFGSGSPITYITGPATIINANDSASTTPKEFAVNINSSTGTVDIEQLSGLVALAIQAKDEAQAAAAAAEQAEQDTEAIATQALADITSAKNDALTAIDTAESDAITAINQAETTGVAAINSARDQGIIAIENARDQAISDINDLVTEAQTARDEAQTAATNAATSETNAANSATAAATSETNAAASATTATNEADRAQAEADSIFPTQQTGTVISFDAPKIFGTPDSPLSGSLTDDLTNARLGVVQKLYHNDSTAPSLPGIWIDVGQNSYTADKLNIIRVEYINDNRIEYHVEASVDQPPPGIVSHWRFNGDVTDSAGGNDGTIEGDPTFVAGISGQALDFDGTDDQVNCGNDASLNITDVISLSVWINAPSYDSNIQDIVSKGTTLGGDQAYSLAILNDGRLFFEFNNPDETRKNVVYNLVTNNVPTGEFVHICGTYDGTILRLYIDGIQVNSASATGSIRTIADNLKIGGARFFVGTIDEPRIYNRALTADEVQTLYNNPGI